MHGDRRRQLSAMVSSPETPKQYLDRQAQEWRGKALSVALSVGPIHHSESSRKAEEKTAPKRRPKK
jgi:hypothetical protein